MSNIKLRAFLKEDIEEGICRPFLLVETRGDVRFEWNDVRQEPPYTYAIGTILADDDWVVDGCTGLVDSTGSDIYVNDVVEIDYGHASIVVPVTHTGRLHEFNPFEIVKMAIVSNTYTVGRHERG